MDWRLSAAGLVIGLLVGFSGMGGGSLLTPALVLLFGFNPTVAVGTDIFHGAIFKSVGAASHRRAGNVAARLSGWMFVGSAPASLAGVATATALTHRYGGGVASVQGRILGAALLLGGVGLIAKAVVRFRERPDAPFRLTRRDRIVAVVIGLLGGFVVGLTSVGSGVFFGLTLLVVFPLRSAKVVGTDTAHAAALLWVAGAGHLAAGNVDLPSVAALLVGSVPGVLVGSRVTPRVPERTFRFVFGTLLGLSGIEILELPGRAAAQAAFLVLVALVLGTWFLVRRRLPAPVLDTKG